MSLNLKSSGGGSVTVDVPSTASNYTATLPAANGTVQVSGNQPAFSAYQSTLQAVSANTFTKVQLQTKEFDTNTNFDSTTNYRFTPTVAGYYQVSGSAAYGAATGGQILSIYKNGSRFKEGNSANSSNLALTVSALIYFNGSTDYVELYLYQNSGGSVNTTATQYQTWFSGCLARAA